VKKQLSLAVDKLEQERQQLLNSLNILKAGAVSALVEKEEQIQELQKAGLHYQEDYQQLIQ
jgi:hypothetical protein